VSGLQPAAQAARIKDSYPPISAVALFIWCYIFRQSPLNPPSGRARGTGKLHRGSNDGKRREKPCSENSSQN